MAPVSVLTFITGAAPSMRRADTLPRFRVASVLCVSAVTGYNRDTGIRTPVQSKGFEQMPQVRSLGFTI